MPQTVLSFVEGYRNQIPIENWGLTPTSRSSWGSEDCDDRQQRSGARTGGGCGFSLSLILPKAALHTAARTIGHIDSLRFVVLLLKSCPTLLWPHAWKPTRLLCPWDFPGKNTGVGCHFLLQGIFLTQRFNLCPLYWQADSLPLSHLGSSER